MAPLLEVAALRVLAHEEVVAPLRVAERIRILRPRDVRLAAVGELRLVARAAPRARDDQRHQCATAAAPCSSMSAPVLKRSSENAAFSACGRSCAIVCANTQ